MVGETYYFKVEPIKWRILAKDDKTALILSENVLINKRFDDSSNAYSTSEIRTWLNGEFYNLVFAETEKSLISTTRVDMGSSNLMDKVFLLSEAQAANTSYFSGNYQRKKITTDYARAMGAYMSTYTSYYGCGYWWLRSLGNTSCSYEINY